ncbi:MAG: NAD-dependent epimerase/dehydratase family protein [Pseudomonadota bacterium]
MIGGAGFLGSHLVSALRGTGRDVLVVGRSDREAVTLPSGVVYLQGDIQNRTFIAGALQGVDELVDLAYSSVPKTSFENPIQDIVDNLPGSVALFDVASGLNLRKMVFVSSGGTVYGEALQLPVAETHPTNPISPYGITKLALEKYAQLYHRMRQLPVLCVRPSNPYGEGQKPYVGQGFIATAMASMLSGQEIRVFGQQGTVRDYIYVEDVAQALVCALDLGLPGESYNIGSSVGRSNLEVLNEISRVALASGIQPKITHVEPRSFDVAANVLDVEKLQALSGWQPKTGFAEGIARTWDWYGRNAGVPDA